MRQVEGSEIVEPQNEKFFIQAQENGVFLTVSPPAEGETLELSRIFDVLAMQNINEFDRLAIEEAAKAKTGEPVKIAEPQQKKPDAIIGVTVSRDRMEAYLQIELPERANKPDIDVVKKQLEKSGVTEGLLEDAIVLAIRQPNLRVVCAKGRFPENGVDARIEYRVDLENRGKPVETADGGVDFKNLGLYINVEKGQVLAEKIVATPGVPGVDVCGNVVPSRPGKDILLHPGSNIQVVDGVKLVAATGGNLMQAGGKLTVAPVLQIKGDVDLSTGNIDFAGDVVIQGSVQEGFSVKAGGNVDIAGMVSGGNVQGLNVTIRLGILGLNKGEISAAGTVVAKFVENASVSADQDILISDVVLHSRLNAGKQIRVEGRRGQIVGGTAAAGDEIVAKSVGSSSATPTELQAGVNPKLREEYFSLRKELKIVETGLDQLQKGLFTLRSMDQNLLPPEKKELLLKLTRAHFTTLGQAETMRKRMCELETAYEDLKGGQIKVSDYIYPGVKISIGSLVKPIQEECRFMTFYAEAGEVKFRSFK